MRIIAGEFRGRRLLPPDTDATRPVTDRVKQSLFDILSPWMNDAIVYDCFAGTGSMGLESLSRGARHATFFEAHRPAIARLRKNIATLAVEPQSQVITQDLFRWFDMTPAVTDDRRADVVFLDPPYRFLREQPTTLQHLARQIAGNHLKGDGLVVFRHDAADALQLPALRVDEVRTYGGMTLEFLRLPASGGESSHNPDSAS
jgi:16S rRNA (guanine966-N2)-methyltransferase